jgi:hypothetical protein
VVAEVVVAEVVVAEVVVAEVVVAEVVVAEVETHRVSPFLLWQLHLTRNQRNKCKQHTVGQLRVVATPMNQKSSGLLKYYG